MSRFCGFGTRVYIRSCVNLRTLFTSADSLPQDVHRCRFTPQQDTSTQLAIDSPRVNIINPYATDIVSVNMFSDYISDCLNHTLDLSARFRRLHSHLPTAQQAQQAQHMLKSLTRCGQQ